MPLLGLLANECMIPSVRNGLMTTTTCSDHGAEVSFNSVNNDQQTSVDYVCTSESGETVKKFTFRHEAQSHSYYQWQ